MKSVRKILVAVLLLVSTCNTISSCSSAPDLNYIDDQAGLLSAAQSDRLEQFHHRMLKEQDVHFFVAILDQAAPDLNQTALELFAQHQLGLTTSGARGLLLVVDLKRKQARIEVGYDLEDILPDGFIAALEYDQMLPFFRQNRIGHGIEALTELLVNRLARHNSSAPPVHSSDDYLSGGAGARINTASDDPTDRPDEHYAIRDFQPQSTPLKTLLRYRDSLAMRIKDPDLPIYTADSRVFFRNWLVTDAQQDNALRLLDEALPSAETIKQGSQAVIRFPADNRQASPYFFIKSQAGWQLDFLTMSETIIFNHRNQWHFKTLRHPYISAFGDWTFDTHGFPHTR